MACLQFLHFVLPCFYTSVMASVTLIKYYWWSGLVKPTAQYGMDQLNKIENFRTNRISHATEQFVLTHRLLHLSDLLEHLRREHKVLEICPLFLNGVDIDEGLVYEMASPAFLETTLNSWHVNTSDGDDVTRWALSCHWALSYQIDSSRNMTNRYLIWRFLNLDILIGNELALFDL